MRSSFQAMRWSCQVPSPIRMARATRRRETPERRASAPCAGRRRSLLEAPFLGLVVVLQIDQHALERPHEDEAETMLKAVHMTRWSQIGGS